MQAFCIVDIIAFYCPVTTLLGGYTGSRKTRQKNTLVIIILFINLTLPLILIRFSN